MLIVHWFIYIYVLSILTFILIVSRGADTHHRVSTRYLRIAIISTFALLCFEATSWAMNGKPGLLPHLLNTMSVNGLYLVNFIPVASLIIYYDLLIFKSADLVLRRLKWLAIPQMFLLIMTITNPWTRLVFTIDPTNTYNRGPAMPYLTLIASASLIIYALGMIPHMKTVEGRLVRGLLLLTTMPIAGAYLQVLFYGLPALWTTLSLLILFTYVVVEKEEAMRDGLTGLKNRIQLESALRARMKKGYPFTLVMLDMDDFKSINDTYGHDEGDRALIAVSKLLEQSAYPKDVVSRYGGDEFILLLKSTDETAGDAFKERLEAKVTHYNRSSSKPYRLGVSVGFAYITPMDGKEMDEQQLYALADERMYEEKTRRKMIRRQGVPIH